MGDSISRRDFIRAGAISLGTIAVAGPAAARHGLAGVAAGDPGGMPGKDGKPARVLFTKDISSAGMLGIYAALMHGRRLPGKVAVKLHSGEPGGHHYLAPDLIKGLVQAVSGTIVECNTAYPGKRFTPDQSMAVLRDHGFAAIAPVDVLDAEGSLSLPCPAGSRHLKENFVGSHLATYDSFLLLSHFKGHAMGGFGGALKNMSIGIASGEGKMWIHTAGATRSRAEFGRAFQTPQDAFLESMAEAAGSVMKRFGENIVYINVMNNLSVDCDCDSTPAPPELENIGVLAATDAVALDRACVDLVYAADSARSASLRKRIESRNGTHTLDHAAALGLGTLKYDLVRIDG